MKWILCIFMCGTLTLFAQTRVVKGNVTDTGGEPVIGAGVVVKGTTNGTITDAEGGFTLTVSSSATIQVSYIGYKTQEIAVGNRTTLNIVLEEDEQQLDEVVVVAFGTAKKSAFTGSVGVVDAESISKSLQTNIAQTLVGQVPGLQLANSTGQFGSSPQILVRGFGSISSDNEPLYVVDGMPFDGDLNNLNPADIESLTVLKDAASNALYGARGANGVIMITTKSAKKGEAKITFDTRIGTNSVAMKTYDYIKSPALWYETYYKSLYNQRISLGDDAAKAHAYANGLASGATSNNYLVYTVPSGQDFIGTDGKINPGATLGRLVTYEGQDYWLEPEDWKKEGTKIGIRQEYNLNVSGSSDKINYYASLSYLGNEGITTGSYMTRISTRGKVDYQAKKWLKLGTNLSYTNYVYDKVGDGTIGSTGSVWSMVTAMAPIYPVYLRDGNKNIMYDSYGQQMYDFGFAAGLSRPNFAGSNPLFNNKYNTNNTEGNATTFNGYADINFLPELKLTINGGVNNDESRYTYVSDPYTEIYGSSQQGGYVSKSHSRRWSYNVQQILNYTQSFDVNHVNLMVGHEYYKTIYSSLSANRTKMFSSDNLELNGAVTNGESSSSQSVYNNEGYFSRLQYDYNEQYFLSASFRRDASSRFAVKHRWGNFWSLGGAWLINKESWFDSSAFDMLKFKASIGSQGNDKIGEYLYSNQYSIESSGDQISLVFQTKGNEKISWETNTNFNTGFDFELLKGRLTGSVDYFYRLTSDMLFEFFVAPSNGYTSYYDNVGDMRNAGIEVNLRGDVIRTKDLNWNVNFNITHVSNKIISLPDDKKTLTVEGYKGYTWTEERFANPSTFFFGENLPLYTFYTRKYAGVNEDGVSLWYKDIVDANGNVTGQETTKTYNEASYYLCDASMPKIYGGFGTTLQWKGFDFAVNFNYQLGGKVYDMGYSRSMGSPSGTFGGNINRDLLNAWTPENHTDIPRLNGGDSDQTSHSDRFITDASYLNLQNLNLGYTLPSSLTKRFEVSGLRLYVSMENLWYTSKRQGLDPRYSFFGSTNNETYSPIRTITGGLSIQF
ncbi:MAG: TonB-dependent receptor [Tannerella sp.]|nr:TonB-dependent receptor [Tannerella sp.]